MEGVISNPNYEKNVDESVSREIYRNIKILFNHLDECWNKMHSLTCEYIVDSTNSNK